MFTQILWIPRTHSSTIRKYFDNLLNTFIHIHEGFWEIWLIAIHFYDFNAIWEHIIHISCLTDHSLKKSNLWNYYCSCLSGNRTLRCCVHIMTVFWFLGTSKTTNSYQYFSTIFRPYHFWWNIKRYNFFKTFFYYRFWSSYWLSVQSKTAKFSYFVVTVYSSVHSFDLSITYSRPQCIHSSINNYV